MDIIEVFTPGNNGTYSLYPLDSLPWQERSYSNAFKCAQLLGLKEIPNPEDEDFEKIAMSIARTLGVCSMLLISGAYPSLCHVANGRYTNSKEKEEKCILALIPQINQAGEIIWKLSEVRVEETLSEDVTQAMCLFLGTP